MEKFYKSLMNTDKKGPKSEKIKSRGEKDNKKVEIAEERDERKKNSEFYANKDYIYDTVNDWLSDVDLKQH